MESEDKPEVKIIHNFDESLKVLGGLLHNDTSRKIITQLMIRPYYKNELANALSTQYSLIEHHLKKMESIELVKKTSKKIGPKSEKDHIFYEITLEGVYILFRACDEGQFDSKVRLTRIFKKGITLTAVATPAIITFALTDMPLFLNFENFTNTTSPFPLLVPLSVLGISIAVSKIIPYLKNRF